MDYNKAFYCNLLNKGSDSNLYTPLNIDDETQAAPDQIDQDQAAIMADFEKELRARLEKEFQAKLQAAIEKKKQANIAQIKEKGTRKKKRKQKINQKVFDAILKWLIILN